MGAAFSACVEKKPVLPPTGTRAARAIAGGDREKATAAFRAAEPALMSGVGKGVMHRNTAARRLSRLSARIQTLAA